MSIHLHHPRPALQLASTPRCVAAPADDVTPCEGGLAVVRVVDRHGVEATGCVHHAALLYASAACPRVYPSPGHMSAVGEVYRRAQALQPAPWQRTKAA
jgi:hypothetical protein